MVKENYERILQALKPGVRLVAVSKYKPVSDIRSVYDWGQRIFGENKAQEMKAKHPELPSDIEWHFIGHLQSNKIKYIAPFVTLIHSIDSFALLQEVDKMAAKSQRVIPCLLQFHIAQEETKFGFLREEAERMLDSEAFADLKNVRIDGVMGMATFTEDRAQVRLFEIPIFFRSGAFQGNLDGNVGRLSDCDGGGQYAGTDWQFDFRSEGLFLEA